MPGITRRAKVVAPPRVATRVPGAPPLTTAGKEEFAWDLKQGIGPGDPHGHVLLNAHVWPDGSARRQPDARQAALGDRIVVIGNATELCYRVVKRVQVLASVGLPGYYTKTGPPTAGLRGLLRQAARPGRVDQAHRLVRRAEGLTSRSAAAQPDGHRLDGEQRRDVGVDRGAGRRGPRRSGAASTPASTPGRPRSTASRISSLTSSTPASACTASTSR